MRQSSSNVCYPQHLCKMYGTCKRCRAIRARRAAIHADKKTSLTSLSIKEFNSSDAAIVFRKELTLFLKNQTRSIGKTNYFIATSEASDIYRMQIFIFDGSEVFQKLSKFGLKFSEVKQDTIKDVVRRALSSLALRNIYREHARKLGPISNFLPLDVRSSLKSQYSTKRKRVSNTSWKTAATLISIALMFNSPNYTNGDNKGALNLNANAKIEIIITKR